MHDNRLAEVPPRYAGTQRVDVSGNFMAERERDRKCTGGSLQNADI
jgi:hypothetical protein